VCGRESLRVRGGSTADSHFNVVNWPKWQIKNPKFSKTVSRQSEMSKLKRVYQKSVVESLEWNGL
jgi:hypothetical protein